MSWMMVLHLPMLDAVFSFYHGFNVFKLIFEFET